MMADTIKQLEPTITETDLQNLMTSFEKFCQEPMIEELAFVA